MKCGSIDPIYQRFICTGQSHLHWTVSFALDSRAIFLWLALIQVTSFAELNCPVTAVTKQSYVLHSCLTTFIFHLCMLVSELLCLKLRYTWMHQVCWTWLAPTSKHLLPSMTALSCKTAVLYKHIGLPCSDTNYLHGACLDQQGRL